MEKIGIIFSFNSTKTAHLGEKIVKEFGDAMIEKVNAEDITEEKFLNYNNLILGVPTWFDGELPLYWDEFVPAIKEMDLTGRRIAIYGLGDQKGYPENFCDAIGIFAELVTERGARVIGYTSTEDYHFEQSRAAMDGRFCGLCLDQENQARLSEKRIVEWVEQLKKEFM